MNEILLLFLVFVVLLAYFIGIEFGINLGIDRIKKAKELLEKKDEKVKK